MWVEVEGTLNENQLSGVADNLVFNVHQSGVIDVVGGDNTFKIQSIVISTDTRTHISYDLASREIMAGMDVAVTGKYINGGEFRATYIGPNETGEEIELSEMT